MHMWSTTVATTTTTTTAAITSIQMSFQSNFYYYPLFTFDDTHDCPNKEIFFFFKITFNRFQGKIWTTPLSLIQYVDQVVVVAVVNVIAVVAVVVVDVK